ncbi:MAG: class I SAM-dependent rRNA methyltransferase [Bacteroidota bacterium]
MGMIKIFLKSGKDVPVRRFHPWIFSGAVARVEGRPEDGDMVEVYDRGGELLGAGHFHHGSIAVRLLSFGPANMADSGFWEDKLRNALAVRALFTDITATDGAYRLVHGEGDGLSGLIVDVYGDTAVVQCHSIGMHRQVELIAGALETVYEGRLRAVYDKSYESLPVRYAETQSNGYLRVSDGYDPAARHIVRENGVRFRVDWQTGQKTGFFLDQRDNRQLLSRFAPGKSVLNAFCYTGGFSCYALRAGARLVHSVDISQRAMELCAENAALNAPFSGTHEGYTEDVLRFLKQHTQRYEVAVIDPPAYAKSLDKRHNAVQGYKRLNVEAIKSVAPGGVLFTFSCSQVVDRELFYHTIAAAAMEAGRPVRVLHHLSQGADHPVSLFHPEGSYLKGLVLKLD